LATVTTKGRFGWDGFRIRGDFRLDSDTARFRDKDWGRLRKRRGSPDGCRYRTSICGVARVHGGKKVAVQFIGEVSEYCVKLLQDLELQVKRLLQTQQQWLGIMGLRQIVVVVTSIHKILEVSGCLFDSRLRIVVIVIASI